MTKTDSPITTPSQKTTKIQCSLSENYFTNRTYMGKFNGMVPLIERAIGRTESILGMKSASDETRLLFAGGSEFAEAGKNNDLLGFHERTTGWIVIHMTKIAFKAKEEYRCRVAEGRDASQKTYDDAYALTLAGTIAHEYTHHVYHSNYPERGEDEKNRLAKIEHEKNGRKIKALASRMRYLNEKIVDEGVSAWIEYAIRRWIRKRQAGNEATEKECEPNLMGLGIGKRVLKFCKAVEGDKPVIYTLGAFFVGHALKRLDAKPWDILENRPKNPLEILFPELYVRRMKKDGFSKQDES